MIRFRVKREKLLELGLEVERVSVSVHMSVRARARACVGGLENMSLTSVH